MNKAEIGTPETERRQFEFGTISWKSSDKDIRRIGQLVLDSSTYLRGKAMMAESIVEGDGDGDQDV